MSLHRVCCCGSGGPPGQPPCCGCGSCDSTLTLVSTVTYEAVWQLGGACDLSYDITETTVMTLVRVNAGDGQCEIPPYPQLDCDHCQWAVGAGSTFTREWAYQDVCAPSDPADVVITLGGDVGADPGEFGGLKCGTCFNPPADAATYIIRARPTGAGGATYFEATGGANRSDLCPEDMTWTVTVPTGGPDLLPGWLVTGWDLTWSLTG